MAACTNATYAAFRSSRPWRSLSPRRPSHQPSVTPTGPATATRIVSRVIGAISIIAMIHLPGVADKPEPETGVRGTLRRAPSGLPGPLRHSARLGSRVLPPQMRAYHPPPSPGLHPFQGPGRVADARSLIHRPGIVLGHGHQADSADPRAD